MCICEQSFTCHSTCMMSENNLQNWLALSAMWFLEIKLKIISLGGKHLYLLSVGESYINLTLKTRVI